jgi:hypothetical protein
MQPADLPRPLDALLRYWQSKLHGRVMPSRGDIEPLEIKRLLPYLLLTEVDDGIPPRYRYRLVGTEIVRRFGLELTGHYVDEALKGEYGRAVVAIYDAIVAQRLPYFSRSRVVVADGRLLGSSRLMLPLSADGRRVNMVFTGQIFDFDLNRADQTMWMIHTADGATSTTVSAPVVLAAESAALPD